MARHFRTGFLLNWNVPPTRAPAAPQNRSRNHAFTLIGAVRQRPCRSPRPPGLCGDVAAESKFGRVVFVLTKQRSPPHRPRPLNMRRLRRAASRPPQARLRCGHASLRCPCHATRGNSERNPRPMAWKACGETTGRVVPADVRRDATTSISYVDLRKRRPPGAHPTIGRRRRVRSDPPSRGR
jgi:hypothetical protein